MVLKSSSIFIATLLILGSLFNITSYNAEGTKSTNMFLGYEIGINFHEIIEKCKLDIIDSFIKYKIFCTNNTFEKIRIIEKYHNSFNKSAQSIEKSILYMINDYKNGKISSKVLTIEMKLLNANINAYLLLMDNIDFFLKEIIKEVNEKTLLDIQILIENNRKIKSKFEDLRKEIYEQIKGFI